MIPQISEFSWVLEMISLLIIITIFFNFLFLFKKMQFNYTNKLIFSSFKLLN